MSVEYKVVVNKHRTIRYYKPGTDILHRLDGPAVECGNGHKEWRVDGELHRVDGPACEYASGTKEWYVEDKRHRVDGPAYELSNGNKKWFVNGELHRIDGPAVENADGNKEWWIKGVRYTEKEFLVKTQKHTITIDGKEVEISLESYQKIKNAIV